MTGISISFPNLILARKQINPYKFIKIRYFLSKFEYLSPSHPEILDIAINAYKEHKG